MFLVHFVMPAFNEEQGIISVLSDLSSLDLEINNLIVVDNASTDKTSENAKKLGAEVLYESKRGYGAACLKGLSYLRETLSKEEKDKSIVVFLDADYSDYPEDVFLLLDPIKKQEQDFVLGSRLRTSSSSKAVPTVAKFGNIFASKVMFFLYGVRYTDMGPFRAISWNALEHLQMQDTTWGWTLEMQMKAAQSGLRIKEVGVRYRERAFGKSKISQSLVGATRAATKILWVMAVYSIFAKKLPPFQRS